MKFGSTQSLIQVLWLAQLVLLGLLALALIARKAWRTFPIFTTYVLFNLLNWPLQFYLYKTRFYVYSYIATESLSILLGLAVLYEIFVQLFVSQAALRKLASYLLGIVFFLLTALSSWVIYSGAPGVKYVISGILVSEQAARALEVGLLMFLFVCAGAFGLHWRQPLFGVALGLGLFTTVQLLMMTIWKNFISGNNATISITGMLAFNASLLIWTGYQLVSEKATTAEIPQRSQLEQWNRAVMELLHQ